MKNIQNLGEVLTKDQQVKLMGGGFPESCPIAISLDGTLCLCKGWVPNGTGTCSPSNQ